MKRDIRDLIGTAVAKYGWRADKSTIGTKNINYHAEFEIATEAMFTTAAARMIGLRLTDGVLSELTMLKEEQFPALRLPFDDQVVEAAIQDDLGSCLMVLWLHLRQVADSEYGRIVDAWMFMAETDADGCPRTDTIMAIPMRLMQAPEEHRYMTRCLHPHIPDEFALEHCGLGPEWPRDMAARITAWLLDWMAVKAVRVARQPMQRATREQRRRKPQYKGITRQILMLRTHRGPVAVNEIIDRLGDAGIRLHLVRGHWRLVGPDGVAGQGGAAGQLIWIPMHPRGNKKWGEILTNRYELPEGVTVERAAAIASGRMRIKQGA